MLKLRCEAVDCLVGSPGRVDVSVREDREAEVLTDPTIVCRDLALMILDQGGPPIEVITVINLANDEVLYQHPDRPRLPADLFEGDDESSPEVE